jgi:aspartyl-tRNA(Asn)/glutamyl-tRNA(Gln) amidotransferase subunit A
VPGGSSGGSAAAVAAGVAPLALGTDTGGSVRQPASWCGLVGFKPTYGRLSRHGVIAFASSLDQVGVLSSSAQDVALAFGCMAGRDPNDATSLDAPYRSDEATAIDLAGLKVGLVRELSGEGNSEGVLASLRRTVELVQSLGASIEEVSLPHVRHGVAAYYLVTPAEASANLARFDGMLYSRREGENALGQAEVMKRSRSVGFGAEVKRRILVGTYALSAGYVEAYYQQALKVRRLIANECAAAFARVDLLLMPTTPTVAYRLGEKTGDPLSMYLGDVDTVLANLAGLPAVSFPAGLAEDGMPCGVQLLAPALRDERLLAVARVLEAQLGRAFAPRPPMV